MVPPPYLPSLPPGHHAQPAWAFRDETGRFFYEFNRVYQPAGGLLVRDLSYWSVTWSTFLDPDDERPMGRWLTYGDARGRLRRLTFNRFASLAAMREVLPSLLAEQRPRPQKARERRPRVVFGDSARPRLTAV
jgi:hypothetical protein